MKKFLAICLLLAATAMGTAVNQPLTFSAPGYDSVRCSVMVWNGASGSYAFLGQQKYASATFPDETTFVLQNDSMYWAKYYWWAQGESVPSIAAGPLYPTSAMDVNVTQISGDATAADSLERMMDGTGATLKLSQLLIVADGNKHAIELYGSGTGEGIYSKGGATGHGAEFIGGVTGGVGFKVQGTNTNPGFYALGNGYGIQAQGTGSYAGLFAYGGSTDGPGAIFTGGGNGIGALFNSEGTGADISADIRDSVFAILDTLQDGASGPDVNATATISDADMAAIADTVWQADTTAHNGTAGSYGKALSEPAYVQGAASGLTATEIMDSASNRGFVHYDSAGAKLSLKQLIVGGENNDSASVFVYNTGTTPAVQIEGDGEYGIPAFLIHSDSGTGLKLQTENAQRAGAAGSSYAGLQADARGPSGYGALITNSNETDTADGTAMMIRSDGASDALEIVAGTPTSGDTTTHNMALQIEGRSFIHSRDNRTEDAVEILAYSTGRGLYVRSDSGVGMRVSNSSGDTASILLGGNIMFGANQGIAGWVDSLRYPVSFTGSGDYAMTVWAIDTSGVTHDTVSGVSIKVVDATGTEKGSARTLSDGKIVFQLDSGQYTLSSQFANGYYWNELTCTLSTGDTFNLVGYNIPIGAPTSDSTCRVYGYTSSATTAAIEGATITWSLAGRNIYDVCNGSAIVTSNGSTTSDSTGLWTLDLIYSQCLQRSSTASTSDSTLYQITITYPSGNTASNKNFNVPSADSVAFTW